jgi:mannose-1-phosphate guanylyltransferase
MLHAIIMAGGSGTRFWPASRQDRPKQFLTLAADTPLVRSTYERLDGLVPPERVWVVTTAATAERTRQVLPELPAGNVIAEPTGRNTAACTGLAAHAALFVDSDATCLVFPADHLIGQQDRFRSAMAAGAHVVDHEGGLLTFGVQPTAPETGYGYLELGAEHSREGEWTIHTLKRFVEKPDSVSATRYVESGRFLWNAGIFAWRAADLLDELRRQLPDLATGLEKIGAAVGTPRLDAVLADVYPELPSTSVDFGIMENADHRWTIPVDFPWSDVGSWPALAEELPADPSANRIHGRVHVDGAHGNILISTGPTLSVVGVDDLVVVTTPDAVLVVPRDQAQRVKDVVEALRAKGWDDVL